VDELRHARVADVVTQAADVELGKMAGHRFTRSFLTRPRPAPAPGADWRYTRRCGARSRPGNGEADPAPAKPRHRRTRRWCGPRSGSPPAPAWGARRWGPGLPAYG